MRIELYQIKCNLKRVDKSKYITEPVVVFDNPDPSEGIEYEYFIKEATDVEEFEMVINWDNESDDISLLRWVNYARIPLTGRYYYIVSKTMETGMILRLRLKEDVLMSFKGAIKGAVQIVARNTHDYNGLYIDPLYPVECPKDPVVKKITGSPFSANNMSSGKRCIAFTVSGGGI